MGPAFYNWKNITYTTPPILSAFFGSYDHPQTNSKFLWKTIARFRDIGAGNKKIENKHFFGFDYSEKNELMNPKFLEVFSFLRSYSYELISFMEV